MAPVQMGGDLPALFGAVSRVMAQVGYVLKEGKVEFKATRYKYAGEADIIRALRPVMVAEGLSMFPVGASVHSVNNKMVTASCSYMLAHTSGGFLLLEVLGQGQDSGDKAAPKAMTGALKYALRQAFLIETGDDPDRDASGKTAEEIREQERRDAEAARREALGIDDKGHTAWWRENGRKVCTNITNAGLTYNDVAAYCEAHNKPRPSGMDPDKVKQLVEGLTTEGHRLRNHFDAWKGKGEK